MSKLFSIGELSKIHHVPIKTLRYYDEIGLLKAQEKNPDSGYRYYSYRQFERLNTIMFLKYLEIPLKEIKGYLEIRDKDQYMDLLIKEKGILENKIHAYQQMLASIDQQMTEVSATMDLAEHEVVTLQTLPSRQVFHKEALITNDSDLELELHQLKGQVYKDLPIVVGLVGLTIRKEQLIAGDYHSYHGIYILAEDGQGSGEIPSGTYACLHYRGEDHVASHKYYKQIQLYLDEKGYEICGDGVERVIINHYKSNDPQEYLTEIQVPVTKN